MSIKDKLKKCFKEGEKGVNVLEELSSFRDFYKIQNKAQDLNISRYTPIIIKQEK